MVEVISERVRLDISDGLAGLVLARPDAGNALDLDMVKALRAAAERIAAAEDVRCVLVAAEGRSFCVGGDLRQIAGADPGAVVAQLASAAHEAILTLAELPCPVVTAVQGAVAGGGLGFALVGDIVVAARSTRFRVAYTALGFSPDCGVSWFLPRAIDNARAMDLALTNRSMTAEEAEHAGLTSRVVEDAELAASAGQIARSLADGPVDGLAQTKRLLRSSGGDTLREHLSNEADSIARLAATPDGREGLQAFLQRRAPRFGQR